MLSITLKRKREKVLITTRNNETIEIRLSERNKAPFVRLVFEAEQAISIKRIPLELEGDVCRCDFCLVVIPWRSSPEEKNKEYFCSKRCASEYEIARREYVPLKGGDR